MTYIPKHTVRVNILESMELFWTVHEKVRMYRTTSVSARSSISTLFRIVRTPEPRIIRHYNLFECFWVGKDTLYLKSSFSAQKTR